MSLTFKERVYKMCIHKRACVLFYGLKKKSPGGGLEKEPCLEGAKPLKAMKATHFQLFFKRPWAPKKKWEPKWSKSGRI